MGSRKLGQIFNYYLGRISGWIAAESIEDVWFGQTKFGFYITNVLTGHTIHVKFIGTDSGKISFQPGPEGGDYGRFADALRGFMDGFEQALSNGG